MVALYGPNFGHISGHWQTIPAKSELAQHLQVGPEDKNTLAQAHIGHPG